MPAKVTGCRFTPLARQDLEEIWLYSFHHWSHAQADRYISDILTACDGLAAGEIIGLAASEIRPGYWKYFSGSHSIYYKISGPQLDIIRILHQSRDADAVLRE